MNREGALKVVLIVVGLLFLASAYPMVGFFRRDPGAAMMFSLYVTLGIFLLLAVRNPSANRSLILFTGWSSLAHAAIMSFQAARHIIEREELTGVVILAIIGLVFLALAPARTLANKEFNGIPQRPAVVK